MSEGLTGVLYLVGDTDAGNPATVPEGQLTAWTESGVVEWQGRREDIPTVFANANIVCLPSYREGLPRVLVEAASCGRAIVTTDIPGCREIVEHGVNGLLVPARDAESLADALDVLLRDPDMRVQMGKRGRERVLSGFTSAQVVTQTLAVYRDLVAGLGLQLPDRYQQEAKRAGYSDSSRAARTRKR